MNQRNPIPDTPPRRESRSTRLRRGIVALLVLLLVAPVIGAGAPAAVADQTPGMGFTVSAADIDYILDQIVIAEKHTAAKACFDREAAGGVTCNSGELAAIDPSLVGVVYDRTNDPNLCAALRRLVGNPLLSFGLRTTDGSCNNLQPGQEKYGAADQPFPRLTTPVFNPAESSTIPGIGPVGPPGNTSYAQTNGSVVDSEPRTISNIIVDQTSANPAAVCASQFPTRAQGDGASCDLGAVPALPQNESLPIDNITTDVGLSPPFNSLFTIFGQFFDHGLDKITNGGSGTVFVPLKADDPLVAGADHQFGTTDDLPVGLRFMVLTRGTIQNNADGVRSAPNTDTPFVDQSQTYTSHSSHQLFLRQYVLNTAGKPVSTGEFLGTADGGMATWAMIKAQAADVLGLQLTDANVGNIPLMATDAYGNFIPGPAHGLPQYVTGSGLVEGDTTAPVAVPADAFFINTAFLNDIAHSAAPTKHTDGSLFPDADGTAGTSLESPIPTGSYDDELLDSHFICGDGRCNENIALTAIHQVFHDEHDRLINDIKNTILNDTTGTLKVADWTTALGDPTDPLHTWNGQRLFQAARFVTEMEYQHLVFEEFARKVQPLINPFQAFAFNQTDINPAITAEFAHAVYRFGHSMLDDTIPRLNEDVNGTLTHNDIPLLDGFLNPAAYTDGGPGVGTLDAREAAGSIIMGLSDQTGQEIDEFVVDTLRNHLLGLPLDLPALNMARARSEGIPSLNEVRRQIFAATNDGQLTPYTDWVDFGQNLKHPESLVNFIAAYGRHPSIMTLDPDGAGPILAGSTAARRAAADQLVNGTILPGPTTDPGDDINPPADAAEFMFSIGGASLGTDWSTTESGLNKIDLWVGGLAERTNLFGGLLGSTFNYVFENQLTNLQNGDRFYYLARTPGMNLRAQLEGNSFAELIMRNTTAHSLKADPFANADCKFELRNLVSPAPSGSPYFNGVGSVGDDPASACNENGVLIKMGDGTIRYRLNNPVNVPGINFQGVYNGRAGTSADRIYGGADNDTFWGGDGNDNIEGGDGADIALGGNGNDVITDLAGDDIPKGGPGNDAIDAGPGLDIVMAGDGNDFTNGGANINETFGGAGDDFSIAGAGEDAVFGDSGDDWEEGGDQPDLLIGDSSTLFFDDHNRPGHDILIGQGGDDDYDGEGGDDIFVTGPGVEKNAGASGYDWSTGVGDPQPQNADLNLRIIVGAPPVVEVRDKFNELEALSGWKFDDTLRGDDIIPSQVGGGGFIGCDALDAAGVARIDGLVQIVPPAFRTENSADIALASATRFCLLDGPAWGAGNILLGGAGNDTLEGRGANDIIDGDRWLNVRLSVRTDPSDPSTEIGSTDLMENKAVTGNFGTGTAGMTLQQAVFARKVEIANIVPVREIKDPNADNLTPADCDAVSPTLPVNCDTALFSAPFFEYTLTWNGDGSLTVSHQDGAGFDGVDTLWNIEQLSFCDTPGVVRGTCDGVRSIVPATPPEPAPIADLLIPLAVSSFVAPAGVATDPQTIVLTNTGNAPLIVGGPAFISGGDPLAFQVTADTCDGFTLAPLETCTVSVLFQSADPGPLTAFLNIPNNAGDSLIFLAGHVAAPIATITPLALAGFQAQAGGTSLEQTVTLTNSGDGDLTFLGQAAIGGLDAGDFTVTNDLCTGTLIVGASCTVGVTMTPTSGGAKSATLVLSHDAVGDTTVTLDGFATQPIAVAAPSTLAFAGQVGVVGALQQITVTNAGDAPLTVAGSALGGANAGDFTIVGSNCGTVNPAGSCTVNVRFTPLSRGVKTAQVVITHDAAGGSSTVALSGTATAPIITATTPTAFSSMVTVQSATKTVTVGNTGDANLTIGAVTLGGTNPADFRIVTNGCTTVAPAGTCSIAVAFRPTATGTRRATLNIANNTGTPKVVNLIGTGLTPIPVMVVQANLAFANTRIGTTRTAALRLTNNGPGTLNIGTLTVTGQFRVTRGNCAATLAVGRSCTLNVTFAPTTRGAKTGTLTVNSNAVGAPHRVTLTGTGI